MHKIQIHAVRKRKSNIEQTEGGGGKCMDLADLDTWMMIIFASALFVSLPLNRVAVIKKPSVVAPAPPSLSLYCFRSVLLVLYFEARPFDYGLLLLNPRGISIGLYFNNSSSGGRLLLLLMLLLRFQEILHNLHGFDIPLASTTTLGAATTLRNCI